MQTEQTQELSGLGAALTSSKWVQTGEIISVFAVAAVIILAGLQVVGENLFARQLVIVTANVIMLVMIWLGLRLRKQGWEHFGLSLKFEGWRNVFFIFLKSLVVCVVAISGFIFGSIVMANIVGIPGQADLSSYNYLSGNLPLLIVSLIGVFIVSSFGEEVIYRAFLINRISELGDQSKTAVRLSVMISAIVFGFAHFGWGWMGIGQTTFMGLALALMYFLFKRNLWILVLAHAYMDALLLIPLYFSK
jgi:membrane protease YdiL (CAAX protease family)